MRRTSKAAVIEQTLPQAALNEQRSDDWKVVISGFNPNKPAVLYFHTDLETPTVEPSNVSWLVAKLDESASLMCLTAS